MIEWQEVSLGNVADFVTDKISASKVTLNNYISTDNMQVDRGGVIAASTLPQASKFNYYKPTDTLFSNIRTYFRKVWLADREGGASPDVLIFRTKNEKKLNPLYLYYLISGQEFVDFTVLTAKGAKMPRGDKDAMMQFKFHLPNPDEQIEIVEALRCIDQKIELNQRMNETLEGMARAIFKSWFVDFDPVHAKAEGRDPEGMDAQTAALFPDSFTDEGIPEGWEEATLERIAFLNPESWGKNNHPNNVDYVDLANTKWGAIESTQQYSWNDAPSRARRVLAIEDTIVGTVRPGNGSYSYIGSSGLTGSTGFAVMRPKQSKYAEAVFCAVTSKDNIDRLAHLADGGAYPAVRPEVVLDTPFIFAGDDILLAFSESTKMLLAKIEANKQQNQTLAALRDTLLPKLISGELRIDTTQTDLKEAI